MKMWSKQSRILFMINNKKEDTWIKKNKQTWEITDQKANKDEASPQ